MPEDKGYKPTKRRIEKARRNGQVLKSSLLTQSISIVALVAVVIFLGPRTWVANRMLLEYCWSEGFLHPEQCAVGMGQILLETVLPSLIFAALVSIIAEGCQIGFRFDAALLCPRGSFFELGKGFKRMASGFRNSWQILLRLALLSLVFVWFFSDIVGLAEGWIAAPWHEQVESIGRFFIGLFGASAAAAVSFGLLEYGVRRKAFYRELSMSFAELRQEHKEDEGDPQVRSMRHALHHAMTFGELVARTRKSKCIVVEKSK